MLGMTQMLDEGRTHFHEERLQLRVFRAGNQSRIESRDDLLVIGHLVIDILTSL